MSSKTLALALIFVLSIAVGAAQAGGLTVKDILDLAGMGFTEADIRAEIDRTGTKIEPTAEEVKLLKAAGLSDSLIAALSGGAPKAEGLTVQGIEKMLTDGKAVNAVLGAIRDAGGKVEFTPSDAVRLKRAGAPNAVLLALKGDPLEAAGLLALAEGGLDAKGFSILIDIVGVTGKKPAPADALRLRKAGVPASVIAKLGAGMSNPLAEPPAFDDPIEPRIEGDHRVYEHVARLFEIHYPKGWGFLRDLDEGEIEYIFTPETGSKKATDVNIGVSVMVIPLERGTPVSGKDAVATFEHFLPLFRQAQPGLVPEGKVSPSKLGSLEAARLVLAGEIREKPGRFRGAAYMAKNHGVLYIVLTYALEREYGKFQGAFDRVVKESRFGVTNASKRGPTIEASDLVEKFEKSVVSVMPCKNGQPIAFGTGFVIHADGYIATNAHVVADLEKMEAYTEFKVEWTSKLGRKMAPAKLVGWAFKPSQLQSHHGVDVAILKIPPGDYEPVPLTPLWDVKLGDPILTMGFPRRDMYATLNTHITRGVVTRFNRDLTGGIETIYTDAKITHGNSGGPCYSLKTGGAIGLNTYGTDISTNDNSGKDLNNLVGYFGVVPVDILIAEFPLVAGLGRAPDAPLDFLDAMALAKLSLGRGSPRAAAKLAERATKLRPDSADAHYLGALCKLETAASEEDYAAAMEMLDRALQINPDHEDALLTYGSGWLENDEPDKAGPYADRACKAHPESWRGHYLGAQVFLAWGQIDQALRKVNQAKEFARGIVAEPNILAGQILYQKGDLDGGRAEFAEAARIQPTSAPAWIGQAYYFELKKDWGAALKEYETIQGRGFLDDPFVLTRVATCLGELGKKEDALNNYYQAIEKFIARSTRPTPEACLGGARLAAESRDTLGVAFMFYNKFLLYYGLTEDAASVHVEIAKRTLELLPGATGPAFAHACRAYTLTKDKAAEAMIDGGKLTKPTLQDISAMLQSQYLPPVVADMIQVTPLAFGIDPNRSEDIEALQKANIPLIVAQAILTSNKRYPVEGGVNPPQPPQPRPPYPQPPQPRPQHENPLVKGVLGSWRWTETSPLLGAIDIIFTFGADGKWTSRGNYGGFLIDDGGTYEIKGSAFVAIIEYTSNPLVRPGTPAQKVLELQGPNILLMKEGTFTAKFKRVR